jgi:AmmeMemoRadiSam system protein A
MEAIARDHGPLLLRTANQAIDAGLGDGGAPMLDLADYPAVLRVPGASFITLEKAGRLRGCIGSLEAHRPLIQDVAANAYAAAFKDPRFPPVTVGERAAITCALSLLSPPEAIRDVESEADLLATLRPGIDGLILADGTHRATFLPQVWAQLPDPADFVAHLKTKAGLSADHWSKTIKLWRYEVVKLV